jgi:hypothetical protein
MLIKLSEEGLQKSYKFAAESSQSQRPAPFGQKDIIQRNNLAILHNTWLGKIAEIAFAQMIEKHYSLKVKLDFDVYPRGRWDSVDVQINNWNFDIKSSKKGSRWFLLEWNKIDFNHSTGTLPDIYVMTTVDWDRSKNIPNGNVDLIGMMYTKDIVSNNPKVHTLRRGDNIPGTSTPLYADNYGVAFHNLNNNWDEIIKHILSHNPPSLSGYPNPFTNEKYNDDN